MRNIRLGSLLGIPILVNPTWFLLFGLVTWLLATDIYPSNLRDSARSTHFLMAGVSALLFFGSIILHELAHSVVAKHYRIPVRSITLFVFGGVAQITREATRPLNELLMAVAGPLTSLVLGAGFIGAWFALGANRTDPLDFVLLWLGGMNVVLGVFNMLPAFPMDGGRAFRSVVWLISGSYHRATVVAAWTGRGFGWTMMAAGALAFIGYDLWVVNGQVGGLWMVLIGFFLENAARQSLVQDRLVSTLQRYSAGDLMVKDPPVVDGDISIAAFARGVLDLNPRVCYFVEDHGKLAGILSAYQLRAIPEALWDNTTAGEAMVPREKLRATSAGRPASEVLVEMESEDLTHMPVVEEGTVIGVIGRDRIIGVLRQAGLLRA